MTRLPDPDPDETAAAVPPPAAQTPPAQTPPAGGARGSARTLVGGTSWSAVSQFIPLVINLGMTPYIIHGLGDARYGIFLVITTVTMLLSQFDGGIGQAALRFFTIYAGRDDRAATTRLLVSVSAVIAVFGVAIGAAVIVFSRQILAFFHIREEFVPEATFLLVSLTLVVAFLLLRNLYNAVVSARNRFQTLAIAVVAGHLVYAVGLVLTIENGWGLYGVAWTMILQQVVGTVISVPVGLRYLSRSGLGWISRAEAAEFFAYAWRIQIGGIAAILASQKDQLVAARIISAQESGPFGQGTNFANQLRMVPLNALAPIQALIGAEVGAVGASEARHKVERLQRIWVVLVTGWCAVGVPATYIGVKAWLPDSYSVAGDVAAILLAGHYFGLVSIVDRTWALSLGHAGVAMRQSVVSLVANVLFSIALWFPFGLIGVVVGTSIGTAAGTFYQAYDIRRLVEVRITWFLRAVPWWQTVLAAGVTLALELLVHPFLPKGPFGLLGAGLVAAPGMLLFVATTLGVRGAKDALAMIRRR